MMVLLTAVAFRSKEDSMGAHRHPGASPTAVHGRTQGGHRSV